MLHVLSWCDFFFLTFFKFDTFWHCPNFDSKESAEMHSRNPDLLLQSFSFPTNIEFWAKSAICAKKISLGYLTQHEPRHTVLGGGALWIQCMQDFLHSQTVTSARKIFVFAHVSFKALKLSKWASGKKGRIAPKPQKLPETFASEICSFNTKSGIFVTNQTLSKHLSRLLKSELQ